MGYPTLKGYAFGGDFEGYVTFGLGLQTAAGSDQTLPIRVGELVRPDGSYGWRSTSAASQPSAR